MPKYPPNDDYSKSRSFTRRDGTHLAQRLKEALDPTKQPGKVKTLKDMTPAERREMQQLYGKKR
jgi:hypothetical protein